MKKQNTNKEMTDACLDAVAFGLKHGREEGYVEGRAEQRQKPCAYCGRDDNGIKKI